MSKPSYYVGVDVASETLSIAICNQEAEKLASQDALANTATGHQDLLAWFEQHRISPQNAIVCLEATGVYAEHLCYFLVHKGFVVYLEAPHKVHRAFRLAQKTDATDAQMIAEYAVRFYDQLQRFVPRDVVLEQVRTLLTTREQLLGQQTATKNPLTALRRKVIQTPVASQALEHTLEQLSTAIKAIDTELKNLISRDSDYGPLLVLCLSVPGCGVLLAANLLCLSKGFDPSVAYKQVAAYLGICPQAHNSGSSVRFRPRSTGFGLARVRKLLYLASLSLVRNNQEFRKYYLRKIQEGKHKKLVLNNIANKLLKIIFGVVKSGKMFSTSFRSVHPRFIR